MANEKEIWRAHPDIDVIEVSTLGNVRTIDRIVSNGRGTYPVKGHVLKPRDNGNGYLIVGIQIDGKWTKKFVHRIVAQTFLPNLDNLPQINHKDCNPQNNNVENLEWCDNSYNQKYKNKFGISNTETEGHPLFAINLATLEVLRFRSQGEAGRAIGVDKQSIRKVIKGSRNQAGGYYFKEDDGNGIKIDRDKLNYIVNGMRFIGGVFAVNLNTLEVSRFESQMEASRVLGVNQGNIYSVIKGKRKQTGGFWFTNADDKADDAIKRKLNEIKKIYN